MECRMRSRVKAMVEELAREHQRELAAAGTLVDLEELTCQIGDEFARQLCESELVHRRRRRPTQEQWECPECGSPCSRGEPEPVVLQGLRGEVGFNQPSYFCRRCRRSFSLWPPAGTFGPEHGDAQVLRKIVWAGSNLGGYEMAEEAMRELGGVSISAGHSTCCESNWRASVCRARSGDERVKEMDLPKQQAGSTAVDPPKWGLRRWMAAVISGATILAKGPAPKENHWREDKVGCLLSMQSETHAATQTPASRVVGDEFDRGKGANGRETVHFFVTMAISPSCRRTRQ